MFDAAMSELNQVAAGVDGVDLGGCVSALVELRSRLEAAQAVVFAAFAESLDWTVDGSSSATAWLKRNTGLRGVSASKQLKLARFLATHDRLRALLAAGDVTIDHVAVLAKLDVGWAAERFAADLELLCDFAVALTADGLNAVCAQWLLLAEQDENADDATRRDRKRSFRLSSLLDDTWKLDGILGAETGAAFAALIDRVLAEHRDLEQAAMKADPSLVFDATGTQRRADAFAEIIHRAFAVDLALTAGPKTSVNVIVDLDQVHSHGSGCTDSGHVLPPETLANLFCGAELQAMLINPNQVDLNLGRTIRLANRTQRRALAARDQGCRFPGCDRPVSWTVAHHIEYWENGGTTDIHNLILLCHHHHHLMHEGGWNITRDHHGDYQFTSPAGRTDHQPTRAVRRRHRRTSEHLGDRQQRHLAQLTRQRINQLIAEREQTVAQK